MSIARSLRKQIEKQDLDVSPDLLRELVREALTKIGRKGGKARARSLTPQQRRRAAVRAARARWRNK